MKSSDLWLSHVGVPSAFVARVTVYPYPDRHAITDYDINFWFGSCKSIGGMVAREEGKNSSYAYTAYLAFPDQESLDTALSLNDNMISPDEYLSVHDLQIQVVEKSKYDTAIIAQMDYLLATDTHILILEGIKTRSGFGPTDITVGDPIPERYKPRKRNIDPEFPLALKSFDGSLLGKNVGPEAKTSHTSKVDLQIFTVAGYPYELPKYATPGSAGFDIVAHVNEPVVILPAQIVKIATGLKVAIPPGYELQIRSRSGLALNNSIVVANSPGTIDSDYRGEICVLLLNAGSSSFTVTPGLKVAQAVLAPVYQASFVQVKAEEELGKTQRGEGGFGSTGLH